MAIKNHLVGLGTPPAVADVICGGVSTLTAAGTTLGTGTLIPGGTAYVSIVSASGKGVVLPNCDPGSEVVVFNGASNAMFVYPFESTTSIGAGGAGAGFNMTTKKTASFKKLTSTQWSANLTA
jgi:hypothetical protein